MIGFGFGGEFGDVGWMVRSMAIGSWEGLVKFKTLLVKLTGRIALFLFLSFIFMKWSGDRKTSFGVYSKAYSFTSFSTRLKSVHFKDIEVLGSSILLLICLFLQTRI
jgi:hypothetical protein